MQAMRNIHKYGLYLFIWWVFSGFAHASVCPISGMGGRRASEISTHCESNRPADANYHSARRLSAKGQYEKAIQYYKRAIGLTPEHICALNDLAWLLLTCPDARHRDLARAIELAKTAVSGNGKDCAPCWDTLGLALYRSGKSKDAHVCFQRATSLADPSDLESMGNYLDSLKFGGFSGRMKGEGLYKACHQGKGFKRIVKEANQLLFRRKDPKSAIDFYTVALIIAPEGAAHHMLHYRRALAWYRLDENHMSLVDAHKAIRYNPQYVPAYELSGTLMARQGHHDDALEIFSKALVLRPSSGSLQYNRAVSLFHLKHYEEALTAIDQAIKSHPGNPVYRRYRDKVLNKR